MTDQTGQTNQPPADLAGAQLALDELFQEDEEPGVNFVDQPLLVPDFDVDRLLARQKEMMEACFGGIGEERKEEKRQGLAMQQCDIEQRHALRLALSYDDPAELAAHLERCLADPGYGYGQRGDNGRTIAQGFQAVAGGELAGAVAEWLAQHAGFRQAVQEGTPLNMRTLFDVTDLDTFVPLLQRVDDTTWRLGVEGEGKHRDFQGPIWETWSQIADTYVEWYEADNERWLGDLKRKAARLPDTVRRAAWADRLRRDRQVVHVEGRRILLARAEEEDEGWPRSITLGDRVGLSRLSGHSFYELAWDGGLRVRRFELSGTTRHNVPFEHTELAVRLAEALAGEDGPRPEPVTPGEVEAAYLRRMKVSSAGLGPPRSGEPPAGGVGGTPVATYQAGDVAVTMLHGAEDVVLAAVGETTIVLRRSERRGVLAALPVVRGRVRREPLMTTPLAGVEPTPEWNRALCAWTGWLAWAINRKK
ncbi:MAG TPA: hypothetical protein EYP49_08130 [Anaerolineae bacterium]|nr:hypothetical protein [Anaerolineae bacterium]